MVDQLLEETKAEVLPAGLGHQHQGQKHQFGALLRPDAAALLALGEPEPEKVEEQQLQVKAEMDPLLQVHPVGILNGIEKEQ
jgi:hypothetical protein